MKILTYSTLFPNTETRHHGIFVAERLRHLLKTRQIEANVMAPVPWFPSAHPRFGLYARYARIQEQSTFDGIPIYHPRYPVIPKVGMTCAPLLLALASWHALRSLRSQIIAFDLIDAHYFYPDGVAAVLLGRWLGKPVVITGRGTDLNIIPEYALPRRMICWAANQAAGIITVSEALRQILIGLDVPESKVKTLRNGVDLELFRPLEDRIAVRQKLAVGGICILSVGKLNEAKGHHLAIEALRYLPENVNLIVVGEGPFEKTLQQLVIDSGLVHRVRFVGRLNHNRLPQYYNAADLLVLASRSEGMANVLLESLACGTPVVATRIGGAPEVIDDEKVGELLDERNAIAVAASIRKLLQRRVEREDVRCHAEKFSWAKTSNGQLEMFRQALGGTE